MRSIALVLLLLFLSGCQINPYTFQPHWTTPDWFSAGKEDAMNGLPVKDNQTLADSFNDPHVDRREGANKQVISSQADSLIKISRIWAD
ncbi:hypothetical protein L6E03_24200, partial [Enterobacter kobei]|nr:hypothetical protein [Enterobacter kobei]